MANEERALRARGRLNERAPGVRGWSPAPRKPILGDMFLLRLFSPARRRYFSPILAYRDLRRFLGQRKPHELWFLLLSMTITMLILIGFKIDSTYQRAYHPNIIYVKSWPLNRSEAEILAQQKIDAAAKAKRDAQIEAAEKKHQEQIKKIDDAVKGWL